MGRYDMSEYDKVWLSVLSGVADCGRFMGQITSFEACDKCDFRYVVPFGGRKCRARRIPTPSFSLSPQLRLLDGLEFDTAE